MGQVLIRNIDDQIIDALKVRAELKGLSLEQELRDILRLAAGLSAEERLVMIDRVAGMQKAPTNLLSEDVICEIRDSHS